MKPTSSSFGQLSFDFAPPPAQDSLQDANQPVKPPALSGNLGNHSLIAPFEFPPYPHEYKVIAVRQCAEPLKRPRCDTPEKVVDYWRANIPGHAAYNPECECLVALMLDVRKRVRWHYLVSVGIQDTLLVHPREVFRLAVMASANAIVLTHNHPSGDPTPGEADLRITRDLIKCGQLLKIEVLDHVILGQPEHSSLRELGYFY